jgi:hypothetical protein
MTMYFLAKSYELVVGVYFDNYFFAMSHLAHLSYKKYEISPPKIKITFFTLFYVYIVLHSHVKSYKYILTLTLFYTIV